MSYYDIQIVKIGPRVQLVCVTNRPKKKIKKETLLW